MSSAPSGSSPKSVYFKTGNTLLGFWEGMPAIEAENIYLTLGLEFLIAEWR